MEHRFVTKNSWDNATYSGGAKREVKKGKLRYDLIPLSMLDRLAALYTRGAEIYWDPEEYRKHPTMDIEVSQFWNIRRIHDKKIYSKWMNKWWYQLVSLSNNERKHYQVHRLVMQTFVWESDLQVNHIDFNRTNNCIWNLEYVTHNNNVEHSRHHMIGTQSWKSCKLTYEMAEEIRRLVYDGESQTDVAIKYWVSPQTVNWIIKRRCWDKDINSIKKDWNDNNWRTWDMEFAKWCKQSAFRHFIQWQKWEQDEDHWIACCWNIFAYEFIKEKLWDQ